MRLPRVAVLVNPDAGVATTLDRTQALREIVGNRGLVRRISAVADLEVFAAAAREAEVDIVAVCGGDGTMGRAATALACAYAGATLPILAPLGGGTMNTTARSLGLRAGRPEVTLSGILAGGARPRATVRQGTMRLGDGRLGFMVGAGVPARFLALYEQGARLGARRAAGVLAKLIASSLVGGAQAREMFAAVPARAELDGRDLGLDRLSLLYCATIDEIGLGFRPTPRAGSADCEFQVLAGALSELDLLRALPRIWRGRGVVGARGGARWGARRGARWVDACGRRLRIAFEEPTLYMVDGDVGAAIGDLEVGVGPVFDVLVERA